MKARTLAAVVGGAILAAASIGAWTSASQGAAGGGGTGPNDALTAARFSITVDGVSIGGFSELAGISSAVDVDEIDYVVRPRETTLKLPTKRTPPTVTLKRGMTGNTEFADWHLLALTDNAAAQRDAVLSMYDATGTEVARYHLENAWPAKLEIGTLAAGASSLLLETVTLVSEQLLRVAVAP